jgi:AcrR family transcriptional regulator
MTDQKRPYRMNVRAELQEANRRRIAESAAELHATLGPSRTSMSAIAERAGVQRSTLYRHFPDEAAVFEACTAHWMSQHPLPDIEGWATVRDPDERLSRALNELYAYYEGAEPMLVNILRDLDAMEVVQQQFAPFERYMEAAHATLMLGRRLRGRRLHTVRAVVGHALAFTTWQSLVRRQQCTPAEVVEMMSRLSAVSRS